MDRKKLIWLLLTVGGAVGGYVPMLWDSSMFSLSSVVGSAIGGFLGIYIGFKLGE